MVHKAVQLRFNLHFDKDPRKSNTVPFWLLRRPCTNGHSYQPQSAPILHRNHEPFLPSNLFHSRARDDIIHLPSPTSLSPHHINKKVSLHPHPYAVLPDNQPLAIQAKIPSHAVTDSLLQQFVIGMTIRHPFIPPLESTLDYKPAASIQDHPKQAPSSYRRFACPSCSSLPSKPFTQTTRNLALQVSSEMELLRDAIRDLRLMIKLNHDNSKLLVTVLREEFSKLTSTISTAFDALSTNFCAPDQKKKLPTDLHISLV